MYDCRYFASVLVLGILRIGLPTGVMTLSLVEAGVLREH